MGLDTLLQYMCGDTGVVIQVWWYSRCDTGVVIQRRLSGSGGTAQERLAGCDGAGEVV